ncbi:MAG: DUF1844 domain-containing protein [Verrucomicrobiota bacterium]
MSLLSSVLNKLKNTVEPKRSSDPTPSSSMDPREMAQRFAQFVMIQAQNILMMLGKIPTPDGEMFPPNFESAKMLIEQLEMIDEKTKGNLSPQEAALMEKALSQVKMSFIEATGGTPHTMLPSRPMRGMPSMEEMTEDDGMHELPPEHSHAPTPEPQARPVAPAPAAAPVEVENKKKFVKKYN